jgi:hypothetical protein
MRLAWCRRIGTCGGELLGLAACPREEVRLLVGIGLPAALSRPGDGGVCGWGRVGAVLAFGLAPGFLDDQPFGQLLAQHQPI